MYTIFCNYTIITVNLRAFKLYYLTEKKWQLITCEFLELKKFLLHKTIMLKIKITEIHYI